MNNPAGVAKMKATQIARYGSYELWVEHLRENAKKAGKVKHKRGFNVPGVASRAGKKSRVIKDIK